MSALWAGWAGVWRPRTPSDASSDGIGITEREALVLIHLLRHYELIVFMGYSLWRRLILLFASVSCTEVRAFTPILGSGTRPEAWTAAQIGKAGYLHWVDKNAPFEIIPAVFLAEKRILRMPTGTDTIFTTLTSARYRDFLYWIVANNSVDVLAVLIRQLQIDCTEAWSPSQDEHYLGHATTLLFAVHFGHIKAVKLLLNEGSSTPNPKLKSNQLAPLVDCVTEGFSDTAELLLQKGADTRTTDPWGRTPLHIASMKGLDSVVQLLLRHDAPIQTPDARLQWSPLHYAVCNRHDSIVRLLLNAARSHNIQHVVLEALDTNQRTPLHVAAMEGAKGIVVILLGENANPEARDCDKKTPVDLAIDHNTRLLFGAS